MKLNRFEELLLANKESILEPDQMIIWEPQLRSLEEQLEYLEHRAKYFEEYQHTKSSFCEMIADLSARVSQLRKTNQGEGS